jgi:hypothetical protein
MLHVRCAHDTAVHPGIRNICAIIIITSPIQAIPYVSKHEQHQTLCRASTMIRFRQPGVSYRKTYTEHQFLSDLASWIKDSRQSHTCAHIMCVCCMAQAARSTGVRCMPTLKPPPARKSVSAVVDAMRHNWIQPTQDVCPVFAHT